MEDAVLVVPLWAQFDGCGQYDASLGQHRGRGTARVACWSLAIAKYGARAPVNAAMSFAASTSVSRLIADCWLILPAATQPAGSPSRWRQSSYF